MKRSLTIALAAMALLAQALPALADEETPLEQAALLPARTCAFFSAAIVGTPIAIVRATGKNSSKLAESLTGSSKQEATPAETAYATLLTLPIATLAGVPEGVYTGVKNAAENCHDRPFSREAYSLGDEE